MADVKTINANDSSYNIKDEQARTDIASVINTFRRTGSNEILTPFKWGARYIYRKYFEYSGAISENTPIQICNLDPNISIQPIGFNGLLYNLNNGQFYPVNSYLNIDGDYLHFSCYFDKIENALVFTSHSISVNETLIRGYIDYIKW